MEDDKHQPNAFALYLCEPTAPLTPPPNPQKKNPFSWTAQTFLHFYSFIHHVMN